MRYVLFDTEGTGLSNKDEVTQLSYIILNDKLEIIDYKNCYCNTTLQITPFIENLTGLNNKKLLDLSRGKFLEDYIPDSIFREQSDICYLAYNVSFDIRLMNCTLENNLAEPINFGKNINTLRDCKSGGVYNLCLMRTLNALLGENRSLKLTEFAKKYLDESKINVDFKYYCNKFNVFEGGYHSAQYDTFILYEMLNIYFKGLMI